MLASLVSGVMGGAALGLLLGMKHALEPDHLMAVSALVLDRDGQRESHLAAAPLTQRSSHRAVLLGASWGLGHTLALLGAALVLSASRGRMPPALAEAFEVAVAVMLIWLGALTLRRALRLGTQGPVALHQHQTLRHVHRGPPGHLHLGSLALARRPLLVGMVHGLAGSGALTTLVLAQLPTVAQRLVYVALFGLGSLLGMALLSGLAGLPLARLGQSPRLSRALTLLAGAGSVGLGMTWGLPYATRWLG